MVVFVLFAFIPISASAGLFSYMAGFFAERTYATEGITTSIANSQTTTLLKAAQNIDPNPSKGGADIPLAGGIALLSETGPSGTPSDFGIRPRSDQISIYIVRDGDSLSQIGEMFGVSVNTIIWANDLKRGTLISPGQELVILPISGVRHTVVKGDTMKSIAKEYKGNLEDIVRFNGIAENKILTIGDTVIVPDGEISAPVYSPRSTPRGRAVPTYTGYYLRPLAGGIRTQGIHGFNGVDIAAPAGTPILASAGGSVIISKNWGWNGGYGNYVVIRHDNGTQTLYAHNLQNIVSIGQRVVQGQVIGYVGSTGRSTGNHVHFEIRGARNPF